MNYAQLGMSGVDCTSNGSFYLDGYVSRLSTHIGMSAGITVARVKPERQKRQGVAHTLLRNLPPLTLEEDLTVSTTIQCTYDAMGREALPQHSEGSNRLSETALTIPGQDPLTNAYSYDDAHRLVEVNGVGYTYDAVGNRLSETALLVPNQEPVTTTYTYDDANRLTAVNGVGYLWDANGNLLNDGSSTYTYDDANRLVEIENGSTTASHTYNGLGDRVQSIENGTTTTYHLDLAAGLTQVLDESAPQGYGQHTYLYGNGRIGYSSDDIYYFLGDALGSVREVVQGSEDAPVVMMRDYAPYGEVLAGQGTNPTPYGYTGEWTSIPIDFAYMIVRVIPVRTSGRCPYGNDTASYCVARTARPAFCSFCGAEQP